MDNYKVYNGHGPVKIKGVVKSPVGGNFLKLESILGNMTLLVKENDTNLRDVVNPKEVLKVYAVFKERPNLVSHPWARRYRTYMQLLQDGDLYGIAKVLNNLNTLKQTNDLSYGEKKMYDVAFELLSLEIAISLEKPIVYIEQEVKGILNERL